MRGILTERQREMDMLKHRWDRYKGVTEPEHSDYEASRILKLLFFPKFSIL